MTLREKVNRFRHLMGSCSIINAQGESVTLSEVLDELEQESMPLSDEVNNRFAEAQVLLNKYRRLTDLWQKHLEFIARDFGTDEADGNCVSAQEALDAKVDIFGRPG